MVADPCLNVVQVRSALISRVEAWTFFVDRGRPALKKAVDSYDFDPEEFLAGVKVKHDFSASTLQREALIRDALPPFYIIGQLNIECTSLRVDCNLRVKDYLPFIGPQRLSPFRLELRL
jgi:hypothetical protein